MLAPIGINLAQTVPESLRRKLYDFLVKGEKERFIWMASLAGGIALSSTALLSHRRLSERIRNSVVQGRIDKMMGDFLLSGSRKSIVKNAIFGSIAGAITGRVFFKKFHEDVTDPLKFISEN